MTSVVVVVVAVQLWGTLSGPGYALCSPCSGFGHHDYWTACSLQARPKAGTPPQSVFLL